MKIFVYAMREFDELPVVKQLSQEIGVEFDYSTGHPTIETIELARGCEAVSCTPCVLTDEMLEKFAEVGVKYFTTRSIGYDFVNLQKVKQLMNTAISLTKTEMLLRHILLTKLFPTSAQVLTL